jgi:hypothetical protein
MKIMKNLLALLFIGMYCLPVLSQKPTPNFNIDLSLKKDEKIFSDKPIAENAFEIRGTKGYFWKPDQYISEIPILSNYGMNFLATCYGSFFTDYKFEIGKNDWWVSFDPKQEKEWKNVIQASNEYDIEFCFGMNPMLFSSRPLDTDSEEDFQKLLSRYSWFQKQGVKWFYLALDDLHLHEGMKVDGKGQSLFTNRLYEALLENDPECKMIFCPTWYWGSTMREPDKKAYLEEVADYLHEDILCFWTGNNVVSTTVTKDDALNYKSVIGHELILWDNYPVNDFNNSLHLGPLTGRGPNLEDVLYGIMGNPMRDTEMNRIPLFTMADYAYNPHNYNPSHSIVQAIKYVSTNSRQQKSLKELVNFYPGAITYHSKSTKINCARVEFERLLNENRNDAENYLQKLEELLNDLEKNFPGKYLDTKSVIKNDIIWMKEQMRKNDK